MFLSNDRNIPMLVDTGASRHCVDSNLLPGIKEYVAEYKTSNPPMTITTGGEGRQGVGTGIIPVVVPDQHGKCHSLPLYLTFAQGLFSAGHALDTRSATCTNCKQQCLYFCTFKIPLHRERGATLYTLTLETDVAPGGALNASAISATILTVTAMSAEFFVATAMPRLYGQLRMELPARKIVVRAQRCQQQRVWDNGIGGWDIRVSK